MPKSIAEKYTILFQKETEFTNNLNTNKEPDPAVDPKAYQEYKAESREVSRQTVFL